MTISSHPNEGASADWASLSHGEGLILPAARPGSWTRLAVAWRAAINHHVPIGYQDETGFHYGQMPVPDTAAKPGKPS
jgi:hypothetical protein